MRAAVIQLQVPDSREEAIAHAAAHIDRAAEEGARLILLPELFAIPFVQPEPDPEYFRFAEPLDGPSNAMVAERSARHGVTILSSFFEASSVPGVYHNASCTFVDGERRLLYRKSHLPYANGFPEKFYFRPGDEPPEIVDTGETRVGTLICYERHFPELSRRLALQGATVMMIPVASSSAPMKDVFQLELRAHGVANGMFVMCANRYGTEGVKSYFGASAIYGPDGDVLGEARDGDDVVIADLDLDAVSRVRQTRPFLRDRRPELYEVS